jgi:hypothetical protein
MMKFIFPSDIDDSPKTMRQSAIAASGYGLAETLYQQPAAVLTADSKPRIEKFHPAAEKGIPCAPQRRETGRVDPLHHPINKLLVCRQLIIFKAKEVCPAMSVVGTDCRGRVEVEDGEATGPQCGSDLLYDDSATAPYALIRGLTRRHGWTPSSFRNSGGQRQRLSERESSLATCSHFRTP